VSTLVGIIIGAIITWLVAWYYYREAGQELKREAAELRRLTNLMLHGMEHAGWIKLTRNSFGQILGFEQIVSPKSIDSTASVGNPTVKTSQFISTTGIETAEKFGTASVHTEPNKP
jgi:hypothetical protein